MTLSGKALALRIYIDEGHRYGRQPLFEAIVLKAHEMKLAGATVLRGPLGFGQSSLLHTANIIPLSDDLPILVEIVDTPSNIGDFLPVLESIMDKDGLVLVQDVTVLRYGEVDNVE